MGINIEDLNLGAASEDVRKRNPHLFASPTPPPGAPTPGTPAGPAGPAQARPRNPLIGGPTVRLPGGASPGSDPRFSATDQPFQPGGKQPTPYTDVARQADEARRTHEFAAAASQRAAAKNLRQEQRGSAEPTPTLHPGLFSQVRAGMGRAGQNLTNNRNNLAMIGADTATLSGLHKNGSLGGVIEFAAGLHREPVYRRMEREQQMAYYEHHGEPVPGSLPTTGRAPGVRPAAGPIPPTPRKRDRARPAGPVSLHFD